MARQNDAHMVQMSQQRVAHMQEVDRLRRQVAALEAGSDVGAATPATGRTMRSGLSSLRSLARPVNASS